MYTHAFMHIYMQIYTIAFMICKSICAIKKVDELHLDKPTTLNCFFQEWLTND